MKRGRLALLILCGCVLVAGVVWVAWPREREPEYQGRKLSEWLQIYGESFYSSPSDDVALAKDREVKKAVQHIGTNAVPWLLRWLVQSSGPPEVVKRLVRRIPLSFARTLWTTRLNSHALIGFSLLGPEASPAIPQLVTWLGDPKKRKQAIHALGMIGEPALPALISCMEKRQSVGDFEEAGACGFYILRMYVSKADITVAVPALLIEGEWRARTHHFDVMRDPVDIFARDPGTFFSPLKECMSHTNASVRKMAACTLGYYSRDAVLPVLIRGLADPDAGVRSGVTNGLLRAAPEVLTNGVAK